MSNFIDDGTSLPTGKSDLSAIPSGGNAANYVSGDEWNTVMQALLDTRGKVLQLLGTEYGVTGNFTIIQPIVSGSVVEAGLYISAPGNQGGITDGLWSEGRPAVAGVGLQTYRWLYQDASTPEHIVASLESQGTFGIIGNGDLRARYESYGRDGEQDPHFRTNQYPGPGITVELGRNGILATTGNVTRSGSTVTVTATHPFEVGDLLSLTSMNPTDAANFPNGLKIYTVTAASSGSFSYASSGSAVSSTAGSVFTTPTDIKIRPMGRNHFDIVMGDNFHEFTCVSFFADSMVTATGYGASYGGSFILQPGFVTSAYTLAAGSWFPCDSSGGAFAFTLPANGSYFAKPGRDIAVTKTDSSGNAVTLTAPSGVTMRSSTATLSTLAISAQGKTYHLKCDGKGSTGGNDTWFLVSSN